MKTNKYLVLTLLIASFISCKKDSIEINDPKEEIKELNNINTSSSFNWSTQHNITFMVEGLKPLANEYNVLKVSSIDGKSVFFSGNYSMADDVSEKINIPRINTQVRVSFGSINKIVTIENNQINFSYLFNDTTEVN
jgi:hypothetical protein